jgi:hypothetical protein
MRNMEMFLTWQEAFIKAFCWRNFHFKLQVYSIKGLFLKFFLIDASLQIRTINNCIFQESLSFSYPFKFDVPLEVSQGTLEILGSSFLGLKGMYGGGLYILLWQVEDLLID